MVYNRYGAGFKMLREERGLSSKAFEEIGLKSKTLNRFEKGETMLSFNVLDEALQLIGVSLHEYSYILNNGQNDYFIELFEEIDQAFYVEDINRLKIIFETNIQYPENHLIALSAKACYDSLDASEQEEVSEYLFKIEHWGAKELWIFTDTIDQLSNALIHELLDEFLVKSGYFYNIPDYNRLIVQAALNGIIGFISQQGSKTEVFHIINEVEKALYEVDTYGRIVLHFAKGYAFYEFGEQEKGDKLMRETIELFNILGCKFLKEKYQKFYFKIIQNESGQI